MLTTFLVRSNATKTESIPRIKEPTPPNPMTSGSRYSTFTESRQHCNHLRFKDPQQAGRLWYWSILELPTKLLEGNKSLASILGIFVGQLYLTSIDFKSKSNMVSKSITHLGKLPIPVGQLVLGYSLYICWTTLLKVN